MALVAALLLLLGFIRSNLDNIAAMVTMTKMMEDTTEEAVRRIDDGCGGGGLLVPPEVGRPVAAGIAVVEVFAEGFGAPVVAALSVPEPPSAPVAAPATAVAVITNPRPSEAPSKRSARLCTIVGKVVLARGGTPV